MADEPGERLSERLKAPDPTTPEGRTPKQEARERELASRWLDAKWPLPARTCPICATSVWNVGNVVELRLFGGGGLNFRELYPYVPVTCANCGYTRFFNAIVMGLYEGSPEPSP